MATRTPATLRDGIPLPFDCKPFRGPKLTNAGKPFAPKPREVGDVLTFKHAGAEISAPVWSKADGAGCVWAVTGHVAYLVSKSGAVLDVNDYRRPAAAEVAA